jgi:hypothetical protein
MLHKYLAISKHFFTIPTDAHNYKITEMLKKGKIPIIAPTCFGSRRNDHQLCKRAVLHACTQAGMPP